MNCYIQSKKHTDTLIEQTESKPHETLEFVMKKQMETFSLNHPIYLAESKWLLAVLSLEATNSVFNSKNDNSSFAFSILGCW